MERFIEKYSDEEFDLIVIGGGITGAAVAYDTASRGLDIALVEKQDFGCATSSATSKLLHGEFRYPANLEYGPVREEMVLTLKDVFLRRTGIGTLGYPGDEVIDKIAAIVAGELNWDDERKTNEISQIRQSLTLSQ